MAKALSKMLSSWTTHKQLAPSVVAGLLMVVEYSAGVSLQTAWCWLVLVTVELPVAGPFLRHFLELADVVLAAIPVAHQMAESECLLEEAASLCLLVANLITVAE